MKFGSTCGTMPNQTRSTPAGADGAQPLLRLHVGILDHFEEELAECADRMDRRSR